MGRVFYITLGLFFILSLLLTFYTYQKPPIKIGLLVSLTGTSPDLGRQIRDGAFFAVEEINKSGGIKGRKVELIIKNNKESSEIAKANYIELLNEGVIAVVGPETSSIARSLLPLIDENKVLTISPTVSATEFYNRDDYFITLEPNNKKFTKALGKYVKDKIKPKKILIMVDERNPVYTADFVNNFTKYFDENVSVYTLTIKKNVPDFHELIKQALIYKPDFIFILTDVFNASIITQKIRRTNPYINLAIAPWARFSAFISFAGPFSEGVLSIGFYDESAKNISYMEFRDKFMNKFGNYLDSSVINGYNAIMIIKEAILKGADINTMREKILNSQFKFPTGEIKINNYGDSEIEPFLIMIKNGMFEKIEQ